MVQRKCFLPKDHSGKCSEFHFLSHLHTVKSSVSNKIRRDSTHTTGAAWKSSDAGPNRIFRWAMLLSDEELLEYGLDMSALKPGVQLKLREKAADYDSCIEVAIKLTYLTYNMAGAPTPPDEIKNYLEAHHGSFDLGSTKCEICQEPLNFALFNEAKVGRAAIETCHLNPRIHNAQNVGFGHRECNIAQGNKTLEEFYAWIDGILKRASL
ncbi:hypothetical protein [Planococcus dechangensis]|uniref:hypothetical protein n=1 Tax=Planococcus dechangensis TaxID=1176255 RepID=UPI00366D6E06